MTSLNLNSFVAVPIPTDLYAQLIARYPSGISGVLEHVARDFLERTAEDLPARRRARRDGVLWDTAFLPSGTRPRTPYCNEYKFGEIKGDQIVYEEKPVPSVSQLARMMRGNSEAVATIGVAGIEWRDASAG